MPDKAKRFDSESVRREWNEAADNYASMQAAGDDYYRYEFFGPAMLELCGEVSGLAALDLGCGAGYFARRLAERGAVVSAVDISERLVEHALRREAEDPLGIDYLVLDAVEVTDRWPAGSFDLTTSCVSMEDMPEPRAVLEATFRLLRPGGRFVMMITHPCTTTPYREWERDASGRKLSLKIDRYFERTALEYVWSASRPNPTFRTCGFHAPLADWFDLLLEVGFRLRRFVEPCPTEEAVRRRPDLSDATQVPYFAGFHLDKATGLD